MFFVLFSTYLRKDEHYGYHVQWETGQINLTDSSIKVEELPVEKSIKFIGGRGLGTKILHDEGVARVDPLSPENKPVYITGPLDGANVPTGGGIWLSPNLRLPA